MKTAKNTTNKPPLERKAAYAAAANGSRKGPESLSGDGGTRKPGCKPGRPSKPRAVISEGQRLLIAVMGGGTVRELSARTDCTLSMLSLWIRGHATPGDTAAEKLEAALGIPRMTWHQKPDLTGAMRDALHGVDTALCEVEARLEVAYEALRGLR